MNERIRELSEQALEIVSNKRLLKYGQLERTWNPDDYNQVFAELIVRECAVIADEPTSQPFSSYGEKIKQHFGVE